MGRFDKKETSSETNVMEELLPYVDANYRTLRHPAFRMVNGFSMGTLLCPSFVRVVVFVRLPVATTSRGHTTTSLHHRLNALRLLHDDARAPPA